MKEVIKYLHLRPTMGIVIYTHAIIIMNIVMAHGHMIILLHPNLTVIKVLPHKIHVYEKVYFFNFFTRCLF